MSLFTQPLSLLRDVQDVLNTQYRDLDFGALAEFQGSPDEVGKRVADMLMNLAPTLEKFGYALDATKGYVNRQKSVSNVFYYFSTGMIFGVAVGVVYLMFLFSSGTNTGQVPMHTRALNYLIMIIITSIFLYMLTIVSAIMRTRYLRIKKINTSELDSYKMSLSNSVFVRLAIAYARGPDALKKFDSDAFEELRQDADEAITSRGDFCADLKDPKSAAANLQKSRCMINGPCEHPGDSHKSLGDVIKEKFQGGVDGDGVQPVVLSESKIIPPCAMMLRKLFRALEDVRSGVPFATVDQFAMWNQIANGAEVMRTLLTRRSTDSGAVAFKPEQVMPILDAEIIAPLCLDLRFVPGLVPPAHLLRNGVGGTTEEQCWKACYDKGDECRWAHHETNGQCFLGTQDVVPGTVSSVLAIAAGTPATSAASVSSMPSSSLLLLNVGKAQGGRTVFVKGYMTDEQLRQQFRPMIYNGKLTLGRCAEKEDCGVADLDNVPLSKMPEGTSASSQKSTSEAVIPDGAAAVQGAYTASAGSAAESGDYRAILSAAATTADPEKKVRYAKTTAEKIGAVSIDYTVKTFSELKNHMRDTAASALEKYQYRLPLVTHRQYIMKKLREHYGEDAMDKLRPLIASLLTALESINASGRTRLDNAAPADRMTVTAGAFNTRWSGLTSAQRALVIDSAGALGTVTETYQKKYPAEPSWLPSTFARVLVTYCVVVGIAVIFTVAMIQYKSVVEEATSWSAASRIVMYAGSVVILIVALFVSSYKQYTAKKIFNGDIRARNGEALVSTARRLSAILTTTPAFKFRAKLRMTSGQTYTLAGTGNPPESETFSCDPSSPVIRMRLETADTETGSPTDVIIERVSDSSDASQSIDVRSIELFMDQRGVAYTFRKEGTFTLDSGGTSVPLASTRASGSVGMVPVDPKQDKKPDEEGFKLADHIGGDCAMKIVASAKITQTDPVYSLMKTLVNTYDKCNTLSTGLRTMPFPWVEVTLWAVAAIALVAAGIYVYQLLDPRGRINNIRSLRIMHQKMKYGERTPEFEQTISCCSGSAGVKKRLQNIAVIFMTVASLVVAIVLNINGTQDALFGFYSSMNYSAGMCL